MRFTRIMLLAAMLLSCSTLSARDTEISVSYGASPSMVHMSQYTDHWRGLNGWGVANFTIDHRFAAPLWIGLSYTYSTTKSDHAQKGLEGDITYHGLMVNVRYEWIRRTHFKLYSHLGAGALMCYFSPSWKDTYNETHPAFQVSPVGAQVDVSNNFGAFAEVGYGCQGIVKFGLRVGF